MTPWVYDFVRRGYPLRPIAYEPAPPRDAGPLTVAWVVSPWRVGSGGHTTICRLVQQLERRGHRCAMYVFDPDLRMNRHGRALRAEIREHFVDIEAEVHHGLDEFTGADVGIATQWWTAWALRDLPGCGEKVYLVQDDEPQFHETSAESMWAQETYRMGYRCIAYTPWMARVLTGDYGLESHWFECGTDTDTYAFTGEDGREPGLVAVYARRETGRRAVDLAFAALATLTERRPDVRVAIFGSDNQSGVPFPHEDLRIATPAELAALYRRASAGVVFSLTTHSLVAHEMMASGLPIVELEGENVESALGPSGELALLAPPRPDAIADALERVLDEREEAAAMARRARAFVEERTWDRAGDQVEAALRDFVARPRVPS